jgi:hypothetical protein
LPSAIRSKHAAIVLLVFSLLSIVWTWPLAARMTSRIAHDPGDPILNTWLLWWNAHEIPLTSSWWNAPFMVPLPGALALSEHLLGLSIFSTPIQLAGGGPLVAYNVSLLLSYVLSGFFAYLLTLRLTGSVLAAACAGMAFAFAPYRAGQLGHIQVLTSQWMPATLLGMHGYITSGRRRWLILFGASWLLQALSNGYYLLFMPTLLVPWIVWFTDWRGAPRRGLLLLATWAMASLPLVPILLKYREVQNALGLARSLADVRQFSATLSSFTYAPPLLRFWPTVSTASSEDWLFPGLTVCVLTLAGLFALILQRQLRAAVAQRSPLLFYSTAALVMFAFTLGPGGEPDGPPSWLRPYTWLLWLPGYAGLRVPSRFAMIGELCLAVTASIALASFLRTRRSWRTAAALLAVTAIGAEGWIESMPLWPPPQRLMLDGVPASTVIEIPPDEASVSVAAMYRAMYHKRPLVNGYAGYIPYHYRILSLALWRGDPSVLFYLARQRPLTIVVSTAADPGGGFRKMIAEIPGVLPGGVMGAGTVFLLPVQPRHELPLAGGRLPTTLSDAGKKRVVADLGAARSITGIEFALRGRYNDLAGRVLVEVSADGHAWRQAWLGWTGGFALEAALRDPRVALVRIPVQPTDARFVRVYPAESWMVQELGIVGQ